MIRTTAKGLHEMFLTDNLNAEMSKKIGISQPWLWQIEAEKGVPSILFVVNFCERFDVPLERIRKYYRRRKRHFTAAFPRAN